MGRSLLYFSLRFYYFPFYNRNIRYKCQFILPAIDLNRLVFMELTGQDFERQWVLQLALDCPFERGGRRNPDRTDLGQVLTGGLGHFEMVVLFN